MKQVMITGATRGLGLETVRALARDGDNSVIMAVRDLEKGSRIARSLGGNVRAVELDLSSLASVAAFAREWEGRLDALVNNAGVQNFSECRFTPEGYEETIAVNFLAPLLLTLGLSDRLRGGRVVFIGSGTHDPSHPLSKAFGFRGARYSSVRRLAEGESEGPDAAQANFDRYATSKFLVTAIAAELSRRREDFSAYVLDPGLMPGTGLARSYGAFSRFLWKWALPIAGAFMPDTSSPRRSGKALAWLATAEDPGYPPGTVLAFDRKPARYVWREMVDDERMGGEILEDAMAIIGKHA